MPMFMENLVSIADRSPWADPAPWGRGRIAMPRHYLNGEFLPRYRRGTTVQSQPGYAGAAGADPQRASSLIHDFPGAKNRKNVRDYYFFFATGFFAAAFFATGFFVAGFVAAISFSTPYRLRLFFLLISKRLKILVAMPFSRIESNQIITCLLFLIAKYESRITWEDLV